MINQKTVFIGAGNVATHLAALFHQNKFTITQFVSTSDSSKLLAEKYNTTFTTDIKAINTNANLYIIAVPDAKIEEVVKQLSLKNKLIVHTSGSVSMEVLQLASANYGVFYPLQTFTNNSVLNYNEIPFLIEANNKKNLDFLQNIASQFSNNVLITNSEKRKKIHLAAVFANNFTNHMLALSEQILNENDVDFSILKPLIRESIRKIENNAPKNIQTGPAARNDEETMLEHSKMLKNNLIAQKIYNLVSKSIREIKRKKE